MRPDFGVGGQSRIGQEVETPVQLQAPLVGWSGPMGEQGLRREQPGLDVEIHSVEVLVEGCCDGSEIGCRGCAEVQAAVEVVAPGVVAGGSGEAPEVGSGDGVDCGEGTGEFIQELIDGEGLDLDDALGGPDRLPLDVSVQQAGAGGPVMGEEDEGGGLVGGTGRVAVVLEDVRLASADVQTRLAWPVVISVAPSGTRPSILIVRRCRRGSEWEARRGRGRRSVPAGPGAGD